jgi:hypothetical protein
MRGEEGEDEDGANPRVQEIEEDEDEQIVDVL